MRKASFVLSAALAFAGVAGASGRCWCRPRDGAAEGRREGRRSARPHRMRPRRRNGTSRSRRSRRPGGAPARLRSTSTRSTNCCCTCTCSRAGTPTRRACSSADRFGPDAGRREARTAPRRSPSSISAASNYGKAIRRQPVPKTVPGDQDMQLMVVQAVLPAEGLQGRRRRGRPPDEGGGRPSQELLQIMLRSSYELKDSGRHGPRARPAAQVLPEHDTWERVLDGYFQSDKHDDGLMALYRLSEDVGTLTKPRQYTDMAQVLIVAGFGIEGERMIQKGLAAGLFPGDDLSRAQRTLDAAKKKADVERRSCRRRRPRSRPQRPAMQIFAVGKLYFSAGDYAKAAAVMRRRSPRAGSRTRTAPRCCRHRACPAGQEGRGQQGVCRDQGSQVRGSREALDHQGALNPGRLGSGSSRPRERAAPRPRRSAP